MVDSINTNSAAAAAAQQVRKTASALDRIHERVATGKKVNGPRDDAAVFAIAKQLEGEVAGAAAVRGNLAFGEAAAGVAIAAGTAVSDLLIEAKATAVQASQEGLDAASRQALQDQFSQIRDQIGSVVSSAKFGTTNLVEPGANDLRILASAAGDTVTLPAKDLSPAGLGIDALTLATPADAGNALAGLDTALAGANSALASLGAAANRIDTQATFNTTLTDSLKQGVGNLVDANLGEESAKRVAGQVRQRLGVQALSIANSAPRTIASLFE